MLQEIEILKENRLLSTDESINKFESTLENIFKYNFDNIDIVSELMTALDDNTEYSEIMFDLMLIIEKIYLTDLENGLKEFIKGQEICYITAKKWITRMTLRIVNYQETHDVYKKILKSLNEDKKVKIKEILIDINLKKDNAKLKELIENI